MSITATRYPRRSRQAVLLVVLLGHGVFLSVLAYYANPYRAAEHGRAQPRPDAALATTLRLVVNLLPLVSGAVPRTATQEPARRVPGSDARIPDTQAPPSLAVWVPVPAGEAPPAPIAGKSLASEPLAAANSPAVRIDTQALQRALADAEKGTFRGLAKDAGRLDEIDPVRTNPLHKAMAAAAVSTLREDVLARVAKDNECKQELGLSGVGEMNRDNNRDTFMSTYIGAGKKCKVGGSQ